MNHPPNQGFGPFEALSIKPNGDYLRTYHRSARMVERRLRGNPRHSGQRLIDHRPINEKGEREWIWLTPESVAK